MTNEDLPELANHDAGTCLCGHFERCEVCSRSDMTRKQEEMARALAVEMLKERVGDKLVITKKLGYANIPYYRYSIKTGS